MVRRGILLLAVALLIISYLDSTARAQGPQAQQITTVPFKITWRGAPEVSRYRLQIARDLEFADMIFDRIVIGREYEVTLPPGRYFWRVAPAAAEAGTFSRGAAIEIRKPEAFPVTNAATAAGWKTAIGRVAIPVAAALRDGPMLDVVAVNADGVVYALDGLTGIALWTARYSPGVRQGGPASSGGGSLLTPIIIRTSRNIAAVVVASEGGIRLLHGASGREIWKASIEGAVEAGAAMDLYGDAAPEIAVISSSPPALTILSGETGKIVSRSELPSVPLGMPTLIQREDARGLILSYSDGLIEVRNSSGVKTSSIKLDTGLTTPAHLVQTSEGSTILVGSERGLIALSGKDLKPIWRVATDEDAPTGRLESADLDRDGSADVIMVTRNGRIVAVNTANGKIRWYASGVFDALPVFADVDNDGVLDILVAGGNDFAVGLSGRDGTMIWKAEINLRPGERWKATRGLATVFSSDRARTFLVGSDPEGTGLRAVELPRGTTTAANQQKGP